MGSNMAEAHPVGFQWVMEAKSRGTEVVHVDPRFTRTSALADRHVPLRAGSDIAFLGGVINYILSNELDFREYVTAYTNASFLVDESYRDAEDLDGLFSGYDDATASYDPSTWQYEGRSRRRGRRVRRQGDAARPTRPGRRGPPIHGGAREIPRDETLQHPRSVYQLLKRHYARYTPEMVERVCGVPAEQFLEVARKWTENSGREQTAALGLQRWLDAAHASACSSSARAPSSSCCWATSAGRAAGCIALRGHASIQGSTDVPTLFNLLPGYLAMPDHDPRQRSPTTSTTIIGKNQKGFWHNADAYMVSPAQGVLGRHATAENDFASTTCRG